MKKIFVLGLTLLTLFLVACTTTAHAQTTIAIDVNPSLVLELDENDVVQNVILNNEDAVIIIGDMDLVGVDYNVAINAIVGSMVANGYINELANSVLVSVNSQDDTKEIDLLQEIAQLVNTYLNNQSIDGSVITQPLDFDDEAENLADELGISEAKAELILDIVKIDPRLVVEDLALLSINDLNLLLETKGYNMDDVDHIGSASDLGLITVEAAYQQALLALGVEDVNVIKSEVELDTEDGIMIYEVKIETMTDEFKVLINATNGTVFVKVDDEEDDHDEEDEHDDDEDYQAFPDNALSQSDIMQLLVTELNIDINMVTNLEFEQEVEHNIAFYDVEFDYEGVEYNFEVDAVSGHIYSHSYEASDDSYDYTTEDPGTTDGTSGATA